MENVNNQKESEQKKEFIPLSSLSWEEASEALNFPKPNTDGFFEQVQERDKKLKEQAV